MICKYGEENIMNNETCLGVIVGPKKRGDSDKADIVVPHHDVSSFVVGHFECILEDCSESQSQ